ncbi:hypothetical protein HDU96_009059 [Phlyctochytrium bullatum]|nr:hypothetical protein HDU96_009059 [Phlyctochytrium bullatum]
MTAATTAAPPTSGVDWSPPSSANSDGSNAGRHTTTAGNGETNSPRTRSSSMATTVRRPSTLLDSPLPAPASPPQQKGTDDAGTTHHPTRSTAAVPPITASPQVIPHRTGVFEQASRHPTADPVSTLADWTVGTWRTDVVPEPDAEFRESTEVRRMMGSATSTGTSVAVLQGPAAAAEVQAWLRTMDSILTDPTPQTPMVLVDLEVLRRLIHPSPPAVQPTTSGGSSPTRRRSSISGLDPKAIKDLSKLAALANDLDELAGIQEESVSVDDEGSVAGSGTGSRRGRPGSMRSRGSSASSPTTQQGASPFVTALATGPAMAHAAAGSVGIRSPRQVPLSPKFGTWGEGTVSGSGGGGWGSKRTRAWSTNHRFSTGFFFGAQAAHGFGGTGSRISFGGGGAGFAAGWGPIAKSFRTGTVRGASGTETAATEEAVASGELEAEAEARAAGEEEDDENDVGWGIDPDAIMSDEFDEGAADAGEAGENGDDEDGEDGEVRSPSSRGNASVLVDGNPRSPSSTHIKDAPSSGSLGSPLSPRPLALSSVANKPTSLPSSIVRRLSRSIPVIRSALDQAQHLDYRLSEAEARLRARDEYLQNTIMDTARRVQELEGLTADLESRNEELELELGRAVEDRERMRREAVKLEREVVELQREVAEAVEAGHGREGAATEPRGEARDVDVQTEMELPTAMAFKVMRSRGVQYDPLETPITPLSDAGAEPAPQTEDDAAALQKAKEDRRRARKFEARLLAVQVRLSYAQTILSLQAETIEQLERQREAFEAERQRLLEDAASVRQHAEQVEAMGAARDLVVEELTRRLTALESENLSAALKKRLLGATAVLGGAGMSDAGSFTLPSPLGSPKMMPLSHRRSASGNSIGSIGSFNAVPPGSPAVGPVHGRERKGIPFSIDTTLKNMLKSMEDAALGSGLPIDQDAMAGMIPHPPPQVALPPVPSADGQAGAQDGTHVGHPAGTPASAAPIAMASPSPLVWGPQGYSQAPPGYRGSMASTVAMSPSTAGPVSGFGTPITSSPPMRRSTLRNSAVPGTPTSPFAGYTFPNAGAPSTPASPMVLAARNSRGGRNTTMSMMSNTMSIMSAADTVISTTDTVLDDDTATAAASPATPSVATFHTVQAPPKSFAVVSDGGRQVSGSLEHLSGVAGTPTFFAPYAAAVSASTPPTPSPLGNPPSSTSPVPPQAGLDGGYPSRKSSHRRTPSSSSSSLSMHQQLAVLQQHGALSGPSGPPPPQGQLPPPPPQGQQPAQAPGSAGGLRINIQPGAQSVGAPASALPYSGQAPVPMSAGPRSQLHRFSVMQAAAGGAQPYPGAGFPAGVSPPPLQQVPPPSSGGHNRSASMSSLPQVHPGKRMTVAGATQDLQPFLHRPPPPPSVSASSPALMQGKMVPPMINANVGPGGAGATYHHAFNGGTLLTSPTAGPSSTTAFSFPPQTPGSERMK